MKATYYTHKELAKHCADARKKGVKDTIDILVMLSAWAAWDVLNADEEQLKAILEFMTRKCEYVLAKEFTFEDVANMLKDETGIVIDFESKRWQR